MKKILFIRTYKSVGIGGPVPALDILYTASRIMGAFGQECEIKVIDTGIGSFSLEGLKEAIRDFGPFITFLNGKIWEAGLLHEIARIVKKINSKIIVAAFGQIATLAGEAMLEDKNIDYCVAREPENIAVELIESLESEGDPAKIKGIIWKLNGKVITNQPREYITNLDEVSISEAAWDLVDIKEYAKHSNWNGSLKEKFYIPILTSRGCPFDCVFCCNRDLDGKVFRARSAENVFSEIKFLHEKYKVKEFHIFDEVFNYDVERAKKILKLIIDSRLPISLAFPHGIRADVMTEELISLLKRAGTYKLVYGIETATPRLQKQIKKNLDINRVADIIKKTSKTGIIVGGYFMLGFPTQTQEEINETIEFAANSDLDLAAFFKVTSYEEAVQSYESILTSKDSGQKGKYDFEDFSYYSRRRSYAQISEAQLNNSILQAQQRFYLKPRRILRGLIKFPHKFTYLKNLVKVLTLILQSYLIRELSGSKNADVLK